MTKSIVWVDVVGRSWLCEGTFVPLRGQTVPCLPDRDKGKMSWTREYVAEGVDGMPGACEYGRP